MIAVPFLSHSSKLLLCVYIICDHVIWTDMQNQGCGTFSLYERLTYVYLLFQEGQLGQPFHWYLILLLLLWHSITCWSPGAFRRGWNPRRDPWQHSLCNKVSCTYVLLVMLHYGWIESFFQASYVTCILFVKVLSCSMWPLSIQICTHFWRSSSCNWFGEALCYFDSHKLTTFI